jgi:hypothetical protein
MHLLHRCGSIPVGRAEAGCTQGGWVGREGVCVRRRPRRRGVVPTSNARRQNRSAPTVGRPGQPSAHSELRTAQRGPLGCRAGVAPGGGARRPPGASTCRVEGPGGGRAPAVQGDGRTAASARSHGDGAAFGRESWSGLGSKPSGDRDGSRTRYPRSKRPLLYPLSYTFWGPRFRQIPVHLEGPRSSGSATQDRDVGAGGSVPASHASLRHHPRPLSASLTLRKRAPMTPLVTS